MPETVASGDSFEVTLTGDLTISGTTLERVFIGTVVFVDMNTIQAEATSNILYADFGLRIPRVPSVARVADDIDLKITLTAIKSQEE